MKAGLVALSLSLATPMMAAQGLEFQPAACDSCFTVYQGTLKSCSQDTAAPFRGCAEKAGQAFAQCVSGACERGAVVAFSSRSSPTFVLDDPSKTCQDFEAQIDPPGDSGGVCFTLVGGLMAPDDPRLTPANATR